MYEDQAFKYLLTDLQEKEKNLLESLGGGAASDYPAYREMCGQIRGLLYAQSLITDLVRKLERYEDD
jgi:hypothetical protein